MCNNSPAEATCSKNGWCSSQHTYAVAVDSFVMTSSLTCRWIRCWGNAGKSPDLLELFVLQILVAVAVIQVSGFQKHLMTEVKKVSVVNSYWTWLSRPQAPWQCHLSKGLLCITVQRRAGRKAIWFQRSDTLCDPNVHLRGALWKTISFKKGLLWHTWCYRPR